MVLSDIKLNPEVMSKVRWSRRGTCGNAGCTDPECGCALCRKPIGVPDDDPRWDDHPDYCDSCALCRDRVPIMLFQGNGKDMKQATFHGKCFEAAMISCSMKETVQ